jgi:hypothetical protein
MFVDPVRIRLVTRAKLELLENSDQGIWKDGQNLEGLRRTCDGYGAEAFDGATCAAASATVFTSA